MNTNIELFSCDPLENVITCLNYDFDKVIFIGARLPQDKARRKLTDFLSIVCNVMEIVFIEISVTDIRDAKKNVSDIIKLEQNQGNNVFCDITGGEDRALVTLGMVCSEEHVPLHEYVIEDNRLIEFLTGFPAMSELVRKNHKALDIEHLIELNGCSINHSLQKNFKKHSKITFNKAQRLITLIKENNQIWNQFSSILNTSFLEDSTLHAEANVSTLQTAVRKLNSPYLRSAAPVLGILKRLSGIGLICNLVCDSSHCSFSYATNEYREMLIDGGSALEIYTYLMAKEKYSDCMIGVHVDWDGVIHSKEEGDIVNEIDIIAMDGYTPIFISCKSGKLDSTRGAEALNELNTMASYLGGNNAKKVLMLTQKPLKTTLNRAKEMNISVETIWD